MRFGIGGPAKPAVMSFAPACTGSRPPFKACPPPRKLCHCRTNEIFRLGSFMWGSFVGCLIRAVLPTRMFVGLNIDENVVAFDPAWIGFHGRIGRRRHHVAGLHIEHRLVNWALDAVAIQES